MKSNDLENYLLSKYNLNKIEDLDFDEVEEISLNKIDNNKVLDYDFKDFEEFRNLKYLSLQNFKIKNYETNELGRCKKISAIQFSNCKFKSKSRLKGDLKLISFNNCKGFKIDYLGLIKNLEIIKFSNIRAVNLKSANYYLKNLQKAYFENVQIYNFGKLSKLKNLILVEVINCKWNKNSLKLFSNQTKIRE